MNLFSKEFYDLMVQFERDYPYFQKAKEPKDLWESGHFYCHEKTNDYFLAYRHGYSFSKAIHSVEKTPAELAAGEMVEALQWALDAMPQSSFHAEYVHHFCVALAEKAEDALKKARGEA